MKPAKEGAATNLNLVTASGEVYSFLLTEKNGASMPDLKVYVNADPNAPKGKPKYYSAAQVEACRRELDEARAGVEAANRRAAESIASFQQEYPAKLQFSYGSPQVREAVPGPIDLARRAVHVHQGRRHGTARALRGEGRQAGTRQLPGASGHLRRPEGR